MLAALRGTGGAIILCSLTTQLGYLALFGSINQAIRSLGLLCLLGEIACVTAATLLLPALLEWRCRLRGRVQSSARTHSVHSNDANPQGPQAQIASIATEPTRTRFTEF